MSSLPAPFPAYFKPGMYFTVPSSGWVPEQIRRITKGPVAHAVTYVGDQYNQVGRYLGNCIQAQPGGVAYTEVRHWIGHPVYPMMRPISDEQSEAAVPFALSLLGADYSFATDAWLGIRETLGLPSWHWWFRLWSHVKHYECAQLSDLILNHVGFENFTDGRLPGEVDPVDLWRLDYGPHVRRPAPQINPRWQAS